MNDMWSYSHDGFTVHQLSSLRDNYIYLVETPGMLACVDPAEEAPVREACARLGRGLTHILNTHHHWDHTGANLKLAAAFDCEVLGPKREADRIPGLTTAVDEDDPFPLGDAEATVLALPGHTLGHIGFLIGDALFCGDALFGGGCGRLFEGTPEQMWGSLMKIMALPDATRFYCAHEYTERNLEFCLRHGMHNDAIEARLRQVRERRRKRLPTIPGTLGEERKTNPFLLVADPAFRHTYAADHDLPDDPVRVFAHIRAARDRW
jgi:hydroxyacylglutathione hydrolase